MTGLFLRVKPKFKIGVELEAAILRSAMDDFDDGLYKIHPDIERGTDGSVEDSGLPRSVFESLDAEGIEIRTPPLPLDQGTKLMEKIMIYMNKWTLDGKKLVTNKSCGLHINISEEYMAERFDRFCRFYAHLVTLFPERKVLRMFGRSSNSYCHPLFTEKGQKKADWLTIQALAMSDKFGTAKYHAVGLHNGPKDEFEVEERRVEFRCLGGKDYHIGSSKLGEAMGLILSSVNDAFDLTLATASEVEGKVKPLVSQDISIPRYVTCVD